MIPTLSRLAILAACLATAFAAPAAEPQLPTGHWQSPGSGTYTNPAMTGAEFYLNIDVANDGSFRGVWGQYFCTAYPGAYGISIYSCTRTGSNRVSGRFGLDRKGVIDLDKLGRSSFSWNTPSAGELAIDLPKNWQGDEQILYRARLTRDGKIKPATAGPASEGPLLSAVALYREFKQDETAALARYRGKTLELEGRRGALIEMSDGGAAIHIPDGFTARALVLTFADLNEVRGIAEGAKFRFRCTLTSFDYQYVHMENCAIVQQRPTMNEALLKERRATALQAIKALYGKPEGEFGPTLFVSHHLEEVEAAYWLRTVGTARPNPDQILNSLVLVHSWSSKGDETIDTFDFGLPENASNYVLSVRFRDDGHVEDVSMES